MTEPFSPLSPAPPATSVPPAEGDECAEQRAALARHDLVVEFVGAGEEERRRVAEGIHDDSIQVMAAMGMRLQLLRRALRDPDQLGILADAELAVQLSISRLRQLVFDLHPPGLEQEGLSVALAIAVDMADGEAAATYRLDDQLPSRPSTEISVNLFRIAQEALANVREHAQASTVTVTLLERDGGYAMRVTDDGCGFEPELTAPGTPGTGFASMRSRSGMSGGSLRVDTAVGRGTTVEAWLPHRPAPVLECGLV
jgi:signal transduction histidine kinase